jgi:hypothetical protein
MLPIANSRVSPSLITLLAVIAPCQRRLPVVSESKIPMCVIVPQLPPEAVNVTAPELLVVPPGEEAAEKDTDFLA